MQTFDRSFLERDVTVCLVLWLVSFIRFDNVSFLNIVFTREFVKRFSAGLYIIIYFACGCGVGLYLFIKCSGGQTIKLQNNPPQFLEAQRLLCEMAERTGFEPAVSLHPHTLSRRAH